MRHYRLIILCIIPLGVTLSCAVVDPEVKVSESVQFYAIDSKTILDELTMGTGEIFTPQDISPYEASPTLGEPVHWTYGDYFQITADLHDLVWNESLTTWKLHVMSFTIDCEYLDNGPQYANFEYLKVTRIKDKDSLLISNLIVEPRRNSVIGGKIEYYPYRNLRHEIDLLQLQISADDVLQIAENNGGATIRANIENECEISLILNPDSFFYEGWQVDYSPNTSGLLASYKIDPMTGELEKGK